VPVSHACFQYSLKGPRNQCYASNAHISPPNRKLMILPYVMINTVGFFSEIGNMQKFLWLPGHLGVVFCSSTSCSNIRDSNRKASLQVMIQVCFALSFTKARRSLFIQTVSAALCFQQIWSG